MYYVFPVKIKGAPGSFRHINPKAQATLKYVIDHLPPWVEQLMVFGSATTPNFRADSDLDLVIIGNRASNVIDTGERCADIIFYDTLEDFKLDYEQTGRFSVSKQILEGGILVYEKTHIVRQSQERFIGFTETI